MELAAPISKHQRVSSGKLKLSPRKLTNGSMGPNELVPVRRPEKQYEEVYAPTTSGEISVLYPASSRGASPKKGPIKAGLNTVSRELSLALQKPSKWGPEVGTREITTQLDPSPPLPPGKYRRCEINRAKGAETPRGEGLSGPGQWAAGDTGRITYYCLADIFTLSARMNWSCCLAIFENLGYGRETPRRFDPMGRHTYIQSYRLVFLKYFE
ncbi:hypothetical protein RIB2604_00900020 [Aspergillus luchuensis]|uniref:Uncharacterized protein n=1 Tax=Aspergillus kawachii TaxID=1069201 RepID=A0A146F560_ASPKA|nr:hypothetical protein RIB2604_00900020 [Aspergillus luchuensis]